jgi:hypothetical protein
MACPLTEHGKLCRTATASLDDILVSENLYFSELQTWSTSIIRDRKLRYPCYATVAFPDLLSTRDTCGLLLHIPCVQVRSQIIHSTVQIEVIVFYGKRLLLRLSILFV